MSTQSGIAIEVGRHRLHALAGRSDRGNLRVTHALSVDRPDSVDADDPQAMGVWIGRTLRQAGFPSGRVTVALARGHVSLKRMTLPTVEEDELPEMTRLAMRRDLQFDAGSAVIDYAVMARGEMSTTVLAVAVPEPILQAAQEAIHAAGYKISRVSLRSMGSAVLLAAIGGDEAILAVDLTGDSVEFVVLVDGGVRFSRSAELHGNGDSGDEERLVQHVLMEARRSWMSYRIVEDASDVRRAVVMGAQSLAEAVAGPVGEMLRVPTNVLVRHPQMEDAQPDMAGAWPLAGLLLAPLVGAATIDFQQPKKAPDLAVKRRERVLMMGGAAVVLLAALVMVGQVHLARLRSEAKRIEGRSAVLRDAYLRYNREAYRLEHMERWESVTPDWIGHAMRVAKVTPDPESVVLDSWTGSLQFEGVTHDRKTRRWASPRQLTIVLDGEARNRETADEFRSQLVDSAMYETSSSGSEARSGTRHPYGFTYRLRTTDPVPGDVDVEGGS